MSDTDRPALNEVVAPTLQGIATVPPLTSLPASIPYARPAPLAAAPQVTPVTPAVSPPIVAVELPVKELESIASLMTERVRVPVDRLQEALTYVDRTAASTKNYFESLQSIQSYLPPDKLALQGLSDVLIKKSGFFIKILGSVFKYEKILVPLVTETDYLYRYEYAFPYTGDGLVVINRAVYHVPFADYSRGVIRKSRKLALRAGTIQVEDLFTGNAFKVQRVRSNVANKTSTSQGPQGSDSASAANSATVVLDKQGISRSAGTTPSEIDVLFGQQIEALLHSISEEEGGEWEVANDLQPEPVHEGSSVQNSD